MSKTGSDQLDDIGIVKKKKKSNWKDFDAEYNLNFTVVSLL